MASITSLNNSLVNQTGQTQESLLKQFNQLSTGKRVNSAADDASGYAIATTLNTQAAAASTASDNIQDVYNATNVAQGALQQLTGVLQTARNLAVQGVNSFLSPADRADLQAQTNALVQQANTIAQSVNFNGQPLLNGSLAGPQAGTASVAKVTANDIVQNGGTVVTQVAAANASFQAPPAGAAQGFGGTSTTNSTIQVQVVNNNGQAAAVATVRDNATGQNVTTAPVAAGGTISGVENVNIKVGNISLADVGQTATVQIAQATPANSQNSALTVQSGSNEGQTTNVAVPGTNSNDLTNQQSQPGKQSRRDAGNRPNRQRPEFAHDGPSATRRAASRVANRCPSERHIREQSHQRRVEHYRRELRPRCNAVDPLAAAAADSVRVAGQEQRQCLGRFGPLWLTETSRSR